MKNDFEFVRWNRAFGGQEFFYGYDAGPVARRAVRYAKPLLPLGATALDAGCGEGQDLAFLVEQGFDATGWEWTPEGVRKATTLLQKRNLTARIVRHDLRAADASQTFDLVVAINAIQFVGEDAPRVLSTLMNCVAPGGVMGLSMFGCEESETHEKVDGTVYFTSLPNLLDKFAGWQMFETAKLWQWGAGGPQMFVTLVARKVKR